MSKRKDILNAALKTFLAGHNHRAFDEKGNRLIRKKQKRAGVVAHI
jgi:hypothetical protein